MNKKTKKVRHPTRLAASAGSWLNFVEITEAEARDIIAKKFPDQVDLHISLLLASCSTFYLGGSTIISVDEEEFERLNVQPFDRETIQLPDDPAPREVKVLSQDWWRHVFVLRRAYRQMFEDDEWNKLTADESEEDKAWLKKVGVDDGNHS